MTSSKYKISKGELKKVIKECVMYSDSVRFNDKNHDNEDFDELADCFLKVPALKNQPPVLEIGTRAGGSALLLLRLMKKTMRSAVLVTVDPYGDKPYDNKPWRYGGSFFVQMKRLLSKYENHIHHHMTSHDFIRIIDQITFWHKGKKQNYSRFSFIFLDGSHIPATVKHEYKNLFPRLIKGGFMVIDNTAYYKAHLRKYFGKLARNNKKITVLSTKHQTIIQKNY